LENKDETITLSGINEPSVTAGQGIFLSATPGPNGTNIYYQVGK